MTVFTRGKLTALLAFALLSGACRGSSSPLQPSVPAQTETFSGTFEPAGEQLYLFASEAGDLTNTIINVDPEAALFGYGLGIWDGAICTVTVQTTTAKKGDVYSAVTDVAGNFCARVYDTGSATSVSFTIQIQHPTPKS